MALPPLRVRVACEREGRDENGDFVFTLRFASVEEARAKVAALSAPDTPGLCPGPHVVQVRDEATGEWRAADDT